MNQTIAKRAGVELIVIAGVLFAAHEYAVVPMEHEIVNARSTLAQFEAEAPRFNLYNTEHEQAIGEILSGLTSRAESLNAMGADSTEPSQLYSQYKSAADRFGLELERIDPNTEASGTGDLTPIESTGFTIGVSGDFASVASFVGAIQHEFPLTAVASVRMAPDPDNGPDDEGVLATIKTSHFGLTRQIATAVASAEDSNP